MVKMLKKGSAIIWRQVNEMMESVRIPVDEQGSVVKPNDVAPGHGRRVDERLLDKRVSPWCSPLYR